MPVNRTLYLYHVTHKSNWMSVGLQGVLDWYSQGVTTASWCVTRTRIEYAAKHMASRHGWSLEDLIVVRVRVRRAHLKRTKVTGVWAHHGEIPPCRVEWIKQYSTLMRAIEVHGSLRVLRDRSSSQ